MGRQENKKNLFIEKALELFSERGFDAVKISEIAKEVGCTAPALYKHYENKQKLYEALLEDGKKNFEQSMDRVYAGFHDIDENAIKQICNGNIEEQIEISMKLLTEPLHFKRVKDFRKLMILEQFHMKDLGELYDKRYVQSHYDIHEKIFKVLMDNGLMLKGDPYTAAIAYVSPIIVFIGICDRDPSKEEWAKEQLKKHIIEFDRVYKVFEKQ